MELGMTGHNPQSGTYLYDTHRSDPQRITFGLPLALLVLLEISLDFPALSLLDGKAWSIGIAIFCLAFLYSFWRVVGVSSRYQITHKPKPIWYKSIQNVLAVFGLICGASAFFLPAIGIWYYQGVAVVCICILLMAGVPGWIICLKVWKEEP